MANGVTFKIERMQITDAGRFAIRGWMRTVPNGCSNRDYLGCRLDHRHLCGVAAFIHRHHDRALVLMDWLANQTAQSRI
jgi:hypothetical protein